MNFWQKLGLTLLVLGTVTIIKIALFPGYVPQEAPEATLQEEVVQKPVEENENAPKSDVTVYFIGQNENKEEVYKVIKRQYDAKTDGTKLNFAIKSLLSGPDAREKRKGIYSEIPQGTKLISIEERPDKVIINLSGNFQQGGGTDGIYKRLYQLIKTSNKNTALDVYLYIDGKQVDVIGGEGIMINQPLNSKSLEG